MKMTILAVLLFFSLAAFAGEPPLPAELMQAKTVYIQKGITFREKNDPTGNATFVEPCRDELNKWGRFTVVSDPKAADLILRVSNVDPRRNQIGPNGQGGVTVAYALTALEVFQRSSGKLLWSGDHNWAMTWSAKTATTAVVKQLRKRMEEQEKVDRASK
jgi:hypothetical protein